MKKWMYVIFPGIMLALFLVVYSSAKKAAEDRERVRLEKIAAKLDAEKKQKDEAERVAALDAQKRQKEREEEDRKKEADRRRKQEAADKAVRDETTQFRTEADSQAKKAAELEIELDRLRKQRETETRQEFDLAKQVELARIAKQNAEFEEQRLTAMIAQRAGQSGVAQMPLPSR